LNELPSSFTNNLSEDCSQANDGQLCWIPADIGVCRGDLCSRLELGDPAHDGGDGATDGGDDGTDGGADGTNEGIRWTCDSKHEEQLCWVMNRGRCLDRQCVRSKDSVPPLFVDRCEVDRPLATDGLNCFDANGNFGTCYGNDCRGRCVTSEDCYLPIVASLIMGNPEMICAHARGAQGLSYLGLCLWQGWFSRLEEEMKNLKNYPPPADLGTYFCSPEQAVEELRCN
jgi:hypothetical protein